MTGRGLRVLALLPAAALSLGAWAGDDGGTPLMGYAYTGALKEARAEIRKGGDLDAQDNAGETALMYAVSGGHEDIIRLLLDKGARIDATSTHGDTALFYAALKDRPGAARLLLEKGAAIDAKNTDGDTPLMVAVAHGSNEAARVLIGKGAALEAADVNGVTPLMAAAREGREEIGLMLVEKGASLDERDAHGGTALISAAFKGQAGFVRLLIEKGADPGVADGHGETALQYAKAAGNEEIASVIQGAVDARAAERERLEALRRDERDKEALRARKAELEARPSAARPFPWPLVGGLAAAVGGAGSFLWASSRLRRRRESRAASQRQAAARVLELARSNPEMAVGALRDYKDRYSDLSVFPADELLRVYAARDRLKAASPEKVKSRADAERKERSAAGVRALIEADPRRAYEAVRDYARTFGDLSAFSGTELAGLHQLCGRDEELLSGAVALSDSQLLDVAVFWADAGRTEAALRLVAAEPLLSNAVRLEGGCEAVLRVHEKAGALESFVGGLFPGKGHEFQAPYARAFLNMGRPGDCLRLMQSVRAKDADDQAVIAAALAADGRLEESARALEPVARKSWSFVGWHACVLVALQSGKIEEATEGFDRLQQLRPLRRDPALHYSLALACEAAGRPDLASEIYEGFVKAELLHRDAHERAARLPARKTPEGLPLRLHPPAAKGQERPRIAGRYDLQSELGEGGWGATRRAYDLQRDRVVVVKKIRPELAGADKDRARFLHDAKTVSHLDHPRIAALREIVQEGGEVFLVLDFVDGAPLVSLLAQRKRLSLKACKAVLEPVCQAVDYAHLRNVLHRGLKPADIIVEAGGRAKVTDFGLPRVERPGAAAYLAPEQAEGKCSRASDIYALGVCLYEMATGLRPFDGPDAPARKKAKSFAPARTLAPELPKEFDALLAQVLEPDPAERIADALEFFQELKRL
ncbi:MAG: ankyrin repeat domain-containing protein [Elusimicrobia bacterium]|nr:ankyrin repeat domain-containing protein [Elusimicrobiota bacterium]